MSSKSSWHLKCMSVTVSVRCHKNNSDLNYTSPLSIPRTLVRVFPPDSSWLLYLIYLSYCHGYKLVFCTIGFNLGVFLQLTGRDWDVSLQILSAFSVSPLRFRQCRSASCSPMISPQVFTVFPNLFLGVILEYPYQHTFQ